MEQDEFFFNFDIFYQSSTQPPTPFNNDGSVCQAYGGIHRHLWHIFIIVKRGKRVQTVIFWIFQKVPIYYVQDCLAKILKISCCFIEKSTQKFVKCSSNSPTLNVPANIRKPNASGVQHNIHNVVRPPNAIITNAYNPEQKKIDRGCRHI